MRLRLLQEYHLNDWACSGCCKRSVQHQANKGCLSAKSTSAAGLSECAITRVMGGWIRGSSSHCAPRGHNRVDQINDPERSPALQNSALAMRIINVKTHAQAGRTALQVAQQQQQQEAGDRKRIPCATLSAATTHSLDASHTRPLHGADKGRMIVSLCASVCVRRSLLAHNLTPGIININASVWILTGSLFVGQRAAVRDQLGNSSTDPLPAFRHAHPSHFAQAVQLELFTLNILTAREPRYGRHSPC